MVKVRSEHCELPWLIPGKIYELELCKGEEGNPNPLYKGISEIGASFLTRLKRSQHIGNHDWEVVE